MKTIVFSSLTRCLIKLSHFLTPYIQLLCHKFVKSHQQIALIQLLQSGQWNIKLEYLDMDCKA